MEDFDSPSGFVAGELRGAWDLRSPHASLVEALERAAAADAPFLVLHLGREGSVPLDARAALDGALRYAAELGRRGVRKGDRVVLVMPTSADFIWALLGSMLAGAVPVPLAAPMTFGSVDRYLRNLAHILRSSEARHLIATRRLCDAVSADPELRAALHDRICTDDPLPALGSHPALPSIDGSDTAFLQYTSGTTGAPRGAVISHRAVVSNAFAIANALSLTKQDVGVSWLPLFHDMGLIGVVLTALCHPYPVHILSPERFLMSPDSWMGLVGEVGATVTAGPNFGYEMAVSRARKSARGLETLRATLNGAEPVNVDTVERFAAHYASAGYRREAMLPVYGMAENTLAVAFPELGHGVRVHRSGGDSLDARANVSVGRPVAGVRLVLRDAAGNDVPAGGVGEICVGGRSLMDGYFHDEEATAAVLADGWLKTGDLGFVHDGELYVTGRARELIIKGGRNFYPQDLEAVAGEIEGVVRGGVAAFGQNNPRTGTDDIVVFAEVRERDEEARGALTRAIRGELLAAFGVKPDVIVLRPPGTLPRTTSGKLQRKRCAALLDEATAG